MDLLKKEKVNAATMRITTNAGFFEIQAVTDKIIRCVYTKKPEIDPHSPIGIDLKRVRAAGLEEGRPATELQSTETETALLISTGAVTLKIDRATSLFTWMRSADNVCLLQEGGKELMDTPVMTYTTGGEKPVIRRVKTVDGERNFVENLREAEDHCAYQAKLFFHWQEGEQIHGLGQGEEGIYNYRGHSQYLYQHNMRIPVPFLIASRASAETPAETPAKTPAETPAKPAQAIHYGILMDCGSLMTFNDTAQGSYMYLDTVEQLDYYFIYGEQLDDVIAGFRLLTGKAAMLPKWAFGYVQSREKYSTQEELVETAAHYRDLGVGLDCIVQDWKTWPADDWGCKTLDKERYPDIRDAMRRLHSMHVHTMVSIWPNMNFGTRDHTEMSDRGKLLNDLATYDAFDEEARGIYWEQCRRELFDGGFDSWWCDSTEPFSGPDWNGAMKRSSRQRYDLVGGEHKKYLGAARANLYALAHAKGIFENQRKAAQDKRVLNLTRSGYAGIQKYGTVLWSGDISARWDVLRAQIAEGLNMAMSGLPYWTFDIGGFFVVHENWKARGCECNTDPTMKWFWNGDYEKGTDDLGYRELYVRWLQMGAFLPMFRSHGTDAPREIWNFGKPGEIFYDAIAASIALRYRLMPYIYSMAGRVVQHDYTMMRSLLFDFAQDPVVTGHAAPEDTALAEQEFMFGESLLICPVTQPMYYGVGSKALDTRKSWQVYLPAGCGWYDFYTGSYCEGGQRIELEVTLEHIPVFVRDGSILPMEAGLTYAQEQPESEFELHLYPAAIPETRPVHLTYYEDAGDDYGYEQGIFNEIEITWDKHEKTLQIGASEHAIEGGLAGRRIRIMQPGREDLMIRYTGKETCYAL